MFAGKGFTDSVSARLAALDAFLYKGVINCSASPNYPAADAGHIYIVSVAGKIGGASGAVVVAGDMLLCNTDGTAAGDHATVGSKWNILEKNIDLSNITITGGTIDGATIGATTPAAGTFTTLLSNSTVVSVASSRAILASELKGQTLQITGAYTPTLPTAVAGYHAITEATTAAAYSIDLATGTDVIELSGTALTAGNKVTSDGTKRARLHIRCDAAGTYIVTPLNAVFVDGGA